MSGTIQKNDIISPEALKVFQEIVLEFKKIMKSAEQMKAELKDSGLNELTNQSKKTKKSLTELDKAKRKLTRITEQQRIEQSKLGKEIANENEKLKEARRRNRELAREKQGLNRQNKGLLGSFKQLIKSVAAYTLAYMGLQQIIRFVTKDLFNLTKRLDSLDFSIKSVIKDSNELIVTKSFLSKMAANYGQDIIVLTERYTKFRAAAIQSNMTAKETMGIFDSMAKASGVLGLKTDELQGVFLALEQMISKGKVTTEELRRQLGERLPGAFGIMAESLGVSIPELDKMLKKGEVLAHEVLPDFADAVEKAFGIESVSKIETLIAEHGRLRTSWKDFVDELNASGGYNSAIRNWTNFFNRMRIIADELFDSTPEFLEKYLLMSTKAGDAVRDFVDTLEELEFQEINSVEASRKYIKQLEESGFSVKRATQIWNEYYNIREAAAAIDEVGFDFTIPFDYAGYKKSLDEANKDFKSFGNTQKGELQKQFVDYSAFVTNKIKSEKSYLREQARIKKEEADDAYELYNELASQQRQLTKEEKRELDLRYQNYQNLLKARIEINNRLQELDKGGSKKDNRLDLLKAQQALELAQLKRHQSELILTHEGTNEELEQMEYDHAREILVQKLEDLEEQKKVEGLNKKTLLSIEAQHQRLKTELILNAIDYRNKEVDEKISENAEKLYEEEIARIYEAADKARIAEAERARDEFNTTRKLGRDKQLIMAESAMNMIDIERKAIEEILAIEELSVDERKKYEQDLAQLRERYAEADIRLTEQKERKKREEIRNTLNAVKEINQEAFNFGLALNERAMANNEERYRHETAQAGENAEMKAMAEVKYNERKRELLRREAIAQKAQSAFSIIIDTAQAIMATLGQTGFLGLPLTPIIAGIGALQLGTVLAQPIPQFAGGILKDAPETFIAGEEDGGKRELIIPRSGNAFLTPDKPTLFSDKSLIGASVIPNDQTEMILSGRSGGSSVDLTSTNSLLKDIRDKKDNRESVEYSGGYKIVRKNGFTGKYRVN